MGSREVSSATGLLSNETSNTCQDMQCPAGTQRRLVKPSPSARVSSPQTGWLLHIKEDMDATGTSASSTLSVAAILKESAARFGNNIALEIGDSRISYAALWGQTRAYAGALREQGISPGDAVAVLIPNVPDFPRVYYAILSLGAVVVPIHALLKADEIEFVLRDSGAKLLVCAAALQAEGTKGAVQAGVPVVSVLATEQTEGIARLEDLAAASTPITTFVP